MLVYDIHLKQERIVHNYMYIEKYIFPDYEYIKCPESWFLLPFCFTKDVLSVNNSLRDHHLINLICQSHVNGTYFINPHIYMGVSQRDVRACYTGNLFFPCANYRSTKLGAKHKSCNVILYVKSW